MKGAPVSTEATRGPVWIPPTLAVANAGAVMWQYGLRHLIVLAPTGEPIGVVSIRDVLAHLLRTAEPQGWLTAFSSVGSEVG